MWQIFLISGKQLKHMRASKKQFLEVPIWLIMIDSAPYFYKIVNNQL